MLYSYIYIFYMCIQYIYIYIYMNECLFKHKNNVKRVYKNIKTMYKKRI